MLEIDIRALTNPRCNFSPAGRPFSRVFRLDRYFWPRSGFGHDLPRAKGEI
jgi:hypothetical protein